MDISSESLQTTRVQAPRQRSLVAVTRRLRRPGPDSLEDVRIMMQPKRRVKMQDFAYRLVARMEVTLHAQSMLTLAIRRSGERCASCLHRKVKTNRKSRTAVQTTRENYRETPADYCIFVTVFDLLGAGKVPWKVGWRYLPFRPNRHADEYVGSATAGRVLHGQRQSIPSPPV